MPNLFKRIAAIHALSLLLLAGSACSVLPEDIRASLPESMRGDVQALSDYPTPNLAGSWQDKDFPELAIRLQQTGSEFTMSRKGDYRGIPVDETYTGSLDGRAVKMNFSALDEGNVRPRKGHCFGVVSKDSSSMQLTCEGTASGTAPLNLVKR